jgi:hypothetical protein
MVEPAALDALIDTYEHKIGPRNGAQVVARAWVDPAYKERLLTDATVAIPVMRLFDLSCLFPFFASELSILPLLTLGQHTLRNRHIRGSRFIPR